ERLLISRLREGDVDGIVDLYETGAILYETGAILDDGSGSLAIGKSAIRKVFMDLLATGQKFELGTQQEAIVCGDLALTSTRLSDGNVTAEIARRQSDGTWLWVIDRFSVT
ncbi:MAG: YybH family protein, partial [Alphaproteobacteria bacterium]